MRGEPVAPVEKIKETDKTGTKTTFWPDPEIFTETTEIDADVVSNRLREMAFLNKGLKIIFADFINKADPFRISLIIKFPITAFSSLQILLL